MPLHGVPVESLSLIFPGTNTLAPTNSIQSNLLLTVPRWLFCCGSFGCTPNNILIGHVPCLRKFRNYKLVIHISFFYNLTKALHS